LGVFTALGGNLEKVARNQKVARKLRKGPREQVSVGRSCAIVLKIPKEIVE
jgi:hypothetical protein